MNQRDVIVVGAGPAGSTAAHVLARAGWDVVLLEAERAPGHKLCGEFLSPEAQSSLRRQNVLHLVQACEPAPVTEVQLTSRRGNSVQLELPATGWGLSRHCLDGVLACAAESAGAEVRYGTRALGFEEDATGFHIQIRSGAGLSPTELHARALLWATGRLSTTAPRPQPVLHDGQQRVGNHEAPLQTERAMKPARLQLYVGVKQHYAGVALPPRVLLYFFRGGYVGINPIEEGRINICVMASHTAFVKAGRSPARLLEAALDASPAIRQQLGCAKPVEGTLRSKFPVGPTRLATPWGRTAHIGDAVASIAPLCGDGMAMALRSAELCVVGADAYLRGARSLQEWKDEYSHAWNVECAGRCRTGHFLQTVLGLPLLADAFITAARIVPGVGNYFVRTTRGPILPDVVGVG